LNTGASDEEEIKMLLKIRSDLERRRKKLEEEADDLGKALQEIDSLIVKAGFKKASPMQEKEPEARAPGEPIPLKARDGALLGSLQIGEKDLKVWFDEKEDLTVDTPPFQSFLIDRVLAGMRSSDEEKIGRGELSPEEALTFQVSTDEKRITEISVQNYGGERRLQEIRSSLRWTLERMHEKSNTP
jgi:hypothetical protein